jgi:hypothetical protein
MPDEECEDVMRKSMVLLLTLVLGLGYVAQAQVNDQTVSEGNIEQLESSQPIIEYVLAGVFLLASLAIGFKPSKRATEELVLPRGGPL